MSFIEDEHGSWTRPFLSLLTATADFTEDRMGSSGAVTNKPVLLLLCILYLFLSSEGLGLFLSEKIEDNKI